jgi:cytoskeleton protein RodZ
MKTVGKQLQDARMAKGWTPEMAARETKIKIDRLHDLESDDFSNFSSPTYARGFVRTYARSLGIDEYRILRQLDNKLPEDDNATFVNDTGVPYMPEPSQPAKPFQVGKGVYIAGGVGLATLMLTGFILVQSYRAGYFASSTPSTTATPSTNVAAAVPDTGPARAMPADSNAAPVPLPVDTEAPMTPASASPIDTNAAPRAMPVDPTALASTPAANPDANPDSTTQPANVPVATAVNPAPPMAAPVNPAPNATTPNPDATAIAVTTPPATAPISPAPPVAPTVATTLPPVAPAPADSTAPVVPTTTATPPRALPVDLNALTSPAATNAPVADTSVAPAHAQEVTHTVHSLSARESNSHTSITVHHDDIPPQGTAAGPIIYPVATPVSTVTGTPDNSTTQVASTQATPNDVPPVVDAASGPSSLGPTSVTAQDTGTSADTGTTAPAAPDSAAAFTGTSAPNDGSSPATTTASSGKFHGKRLVLTASHDSFIRVTALDGPHAGQSLYSSVLHSGQSISFNGRKYSINVGDPSAVDIALDGINYGPHSDNSAPDTFTVESHVP